MKMEIKALIFVVYSILFVKGTPFHPDSSIDLFKLNEVQEQFGFNSNNLTVSVLNSNETLEVAQSEENNEVTQGSIVDESTIILESVSNKPEHNHSHEHNHKEQENFHGHGNSHGHDNFNGHGNSHHGHENFHGHNNFHEHGEEHSSNNMGPVELGLQNVISASGIATQELFMEMASLSSETSQQIDTKSEILTSHAMNEMFKALSLTETEIKKNQECGKQFVSSYNEILGQVDRNLKTCVHNLTIIGENYKNQSIQILSSISMIAEEIQNLPESCDISQSFAIGTFCTVNNLAEANTRIVMSVKDMRYITTVAKENITKASASTVACNKQLVEVVVEKLKNVYKEVSGKCNQQQTKPSNNNEI